MLRTPCNTAPSTSTWKFTPSSQAQSVTLLESGFGDTEHLKLTAHPFQTHLPAFGAAWEEKCRNPILRCQLMAGQQCPGKEEILGSGILAPQAVAGRALPGVTKCSTNFSTSQQQPLTTRLQQIT